MKNINVLWGINKWIKALDNKSAFSIQKIRNGEK